MDTEERTPVNDGAELLRILQSGREIAERLISENERLNNQVMSLQADYDERARQIESLTGRVGELEQSTQELQQRLGSAEREVQSWIDRFNESEKKNDTLANLYLASFQLHSTLDFDEVISTLKEILINLVGAESFSIMLTDDKRGDLVAIATEGLAESYPTRLSLDGGVVSEVVRNGESFFADSQRATEIDPNRPIACVPLMTKDEVIGALCVYRLLMQKESFSSVDYELFSVLARLAATAIISSRLYAQSEGTLSTIRSFINRIRGKNA